MRIRAGNVRHFGPTQAQFHSYAYRVSCILIKLSALKLELCAGVGDHLRFHILAMRRNTTIVNQSKSDPRTWHWTCMRITAHFVVVRHRCCCCCYWRNIEIDTSTELDYVQEHLPSRRCRRRQQQRQHRFSVLFYCCRCMQKVQLTLCAIRLIHRDANNVNLLSRCDMLRK